MKDNDEDARPGKSARGQHPSWACWTSERGLSAPIQGRVKGIRKKEAMNPGLEA